MKWLRRLIDQEPSCGKGFLFGFLFSIPLYAIIVVLVILILK